MIRSKDIGREVTFTDLVQFEVNSDNQRLIYALLSTEQQPLTHNVKQTYKN